MSDLPEQDRRLDLSVKVPGTPEQVWEAIATGPGISSWFVPHEVEENEGGQVRMDFGGGAFDAATVAVWEPGRRVVFHTAGDRPLAYEWLVEARDGGSCVVRMVCTGFGPGQDWDDEYHGLGEGWPLFLQNLRLHLLHFPGRRARATIPTSLLPGTPHEAFVDLCAELGAGAALGVGDRFAADAEGAPPLAGMVEAVTMTARTRAYHLVLDLPAVGTALVAAERAGLDRAAVSTWLYLYDQAPPVPDPYASFLTALAERHGPAPVDHLPGPS